MTKSILVTGGAGFIASHVVTSFATKYPDYKVRCAVKLIRTCGPIPHIFFMRWAQHTLWLI